MAEKTTPNPIYARKEPRSKVLRSLTVMKSIIGRWKLEILWALLPDQSPRGTLRFGELRRALPGITQHMLTAQLRELEADGLVTRIAYAEIPPRVEYRVTQATVDLAPVFYALVDWADQHSDLIDSHESRKKKRVRRKPSDSPGDEPRKTTLRS